MLLAVLEPLELTQLDDANRHQYYKSGVSTWKAVRSMAAISLGATAASVKMSSTASAW